MSKRYDLEQTVSQIQSDYYPDTKDMDIDGLDSLYSQAEYGTITLDEFENEVRLLLKSYNDSEVL